MIRRPDPRYLDLYDALLFDLDGTLMHGAAPISHAADGVEKARAASRSIGFVTNNASRTPQQVVDHLHTVGVEATTEEIITSSQIASRMLAVQLGAGRHVLVVGSHGLAEEIRGAGLEPVTEEGPDVVAVVQGWAPDLGWPRLAEGAYALHRGVPWLATNIDATLPTDKGIAPGNGSLVAALRHATGRQPQVAGKPEPGMFLGAAQQLDARRPLVIGDRLDTDIEGANRAEMDSLMVLTGVDDALTALQAAPVQRPTWIERDLSALTTPAVAAVVDGDVARCGPVSATWSAGSIVLSATADDVRSIRAVLALVRAHSPDAPWDGDLRDGQGQDVTAPLAS